MSGELYISRNLNGIRLPLKTLHASGMQMPTGQLPTAAAAKLQETWDVRYPDE